MKSRSRTTKTRSLTYLCMTHFLRIALTCFLIYTVAIALYDLRISRAFPDMDAALNYGPGVEKNNWTGFERKYPNTRLIVFDDEGLCEYASDEEMRRQILPEDLEFITESDGERYYRVVTLEREGEDKVYTIYRMHREGDDVVAEAYCILDRNYMILEGDLFRDQEKISRHKLNLMEGMTDQDMQVSRGIYKDSDGKNHQLVLLAPTMTSDAYEHMLRELGSVRYVAVVLILFSVIVGVILLRRRILSDLYPMINQIRNYATAEYREDDIPETVTEFKIIAEEIHRLMGRLDTAQKQQKKEEWERRRVIASLTHDLKTPISVIMGYVQAFRDNRIPEEQREHTYHMLMEKSRLAVDMIDSMSEYAKMEHPDFRLMPEDTELSEFLRQYLMSVYDELTEAGVDLYPELEEEVHCKLDRRMFLRVMNNLIGNTRKYNPNGVKLRIATTHRDGQVAVIVEDDGVGIPPELRDAIFHPFVTSNEARTSGKGTGLGLAIVETIVKSHGGTIAVVDPETEGYHTEFLIFLPDAEENRVRSGA